MPKLVSVPVSVVSIRNKFQRTPYVNLYKFMMGELQELLEEPPGARVSLALKGEQGGPLHDSSVSSAVLR